MKNMMTLLLLLMGFNLTAANPFPARTVTIKNNTGYTLNEVVFRKAGVGDWSETLLKSDALEDGEQIKITIPDAGPDNCLFDIGSASYEEIGLEWVIENADVCKTRVFTFDEDNFVEYDSAPEQDVVSENSGSSIQVTNTVGETIFYLFVRPAGTSSWSGDLLAGAGSDLYTFQDDETGNLVIPGLGNGTCRFDFKATALDESKILSLVNNVDLCNNPSVTFRKTSNTGQGGNTNQGNTGSAVTGTINIANKLGETVFYLYFRKSGTSDWGSDLLKTAGQELYTFQDGERGQLRIPNLSRNNCKFDIKATALDENKILVDARNVDLCTMNDIELVPKNNANNGGQEVKVTNNIGETIFYLYARKSGTSDWGEDLLATAGEVLYTFQDKETGSLSIPGFSRSACKFDFKATALDKSKVLKTLNNVDLCRNPNVTFR